MRRRQSTIAAYPILAITGCSWGALRTTDKPAGDFDQFGIVLDRLGVVIEGDESLVARVVVGTVVAGVFGGLATAITEPGFTKPKAWLYHIKTTDGQYVSLISRSVIEPNACASIKKYAVEELAIMKREDPLLCAPK